MKELIEHITGKRLMERWGVDEHELFQIIQRGLPPYEPWEEPFWQKHSELGREFFGINTTDFPKSKPAYIDEVGNPFSLAYPEWPEDSEEIPSLIFKIDDIEFWGKEFGLEKNKDKSEPIKEKKPPKQSEPIKEKEPLKETVQNAFCRNGDIWEINFEGKKTKFKDLERIRYIPHIIGNPNKQFNPLELKALVKKIKPEIGEEQEEYSKLNKEELEKEGLSFVDLDIEGLTKEDKIKLENIVYDIWDKLQKAKNPQNEKEWKALAYTIFNEYGTKIISTKTGPRFKHLPRLKNEAENARVTVRHQIVKAIKEIKKELPELAEHLKEYISTGKIISYNNPEPNTWKIIF